MLQVASGCFSCAPLGLSFLQDDGLRHQNSQFPLQGPRIWCPDPIIAEGSCQTSTLWGRHLWHHSQKPCEVTLDCRFLEHQGTKAANQINIHIERKQESREVRSACETHSIQRDPTWSNVMQAVFPVQFYCSLCSSGRAAFWSFTRPGGERACQGTETTGVLFMWSGLARSKAITLQKAAKPCKTNLKEHLSNRATLRQGKWRAHTQWSAWPWGPQRQCV